MIDLYAAGTSNGMRARIAVEECGLAYSFHPNDIQKGEQKAPGFLAMNPMGQIPVLVDSEGPGGKPLTLSQSTAILVYCAEKSGRFLPRDPAARATATEGADVVPLGARLGDGRTRHPALSQGTGHLAGGIRDSGCFLDLAHSRRFRAGWRPQHPARTSYHPED